jgi:cathepsin B
MIDMVNSNPSLPWRAGPASRFYNMTLKEISKQMNSYTVPPGEAMPPKAEFSAEYIASLPKDFDGRLTWPSSCIHPIRDQGNCGSCWAFSTSETLSDRGCIATNMQENVILSPQALVECDYLAWAGANGCDGGYLANAWAYCQYTGLVTDQCLPYTSGNTGYVPPCPTTCSDGSRPYAYYSIPGSTQTLGNVANIQASLNKYGPVSACFTLYQDLVNYESGVYIHSYGSNLGGHCVKIVGYNTTSNPPYWIIANSWGTTWAELGGYFWMILGVNECGIEANSIVGLA